MVRMRTEQVTEDQYFPSPGRCIYCRSEVCLSDEHVIPFGLGGRLILEDASCEVCCKITSAIEREVLRGPLLPGRTVGRIKTRRPKERPTRLPISLQRDGLEIMHDLPVGDHPGLIQLPVFKAAGFLTDTAPVGEIDLVGLETIRFGEDPRVVMMRHGATTLSITSTLEPITFARFCAKVGFSYAVAAYGLPAIAEPLPVHAILNRGPGTSIGTWVGSVEHVFQGERLGAKQSIDIRLVDYFEADHVEPRTLAVVRMKFFTSATSAYEVVAGRIDRSLLPPVVA